MENIKWILFSVSLALFCFASASYAASPWEVTPEIGVSGRYDSNFSQRSVMERAAYTYAVEPGLSLGYDSERSKVWSRYKASFNYYDDADTLLPGEIKASDLNFVGHFFVLNASNETTDRLKLFLDDNYVRSRNADMLEQSYNRIRDIEMNSGFGALGVGDKREFQTNILTPRLFYEISDTSFTALSYRNTWVDYIDPGEDSMENRGIVDLIYGFNPKQSLAAQYQIWKRQYDLTTSDYLSNQGKLIYRQQFYFFTLSAGAGYQNRNFDEASLKDLDDFIYSFEISGQNPPAPDPPIWNLRLGVDSNMNNSGSGNNYYYGPEFYLYGGYIFQEKILTDLWASYELRDYKMTYGLTRTGIRELREEQILRISARVGYKLFDFCTISLEGGYENQDSNIRLQDWDNSYVMLRLGAAKLFGWDG